MESPIPRIEALIDFVGQTGLETLESSSAHVSLPRIANRINPVRKTLVGLIVMVDLDIYIRIQRDQSNS